MAFPDPPTRRYRLLVIDAHPRADSLGHALATAAAEGAAEAHEVRRLTLRDLTFDLSYTEQDLEPDLILSREHLQWAEHVVIVYPVWWGSMPALLKGWLDRVFLPGFAFEYRDDGGWDGLLGGRSATLVATMDTPVWVFRWILRAPSLQTLRAATLNFCGITPVRAILFSPVRTSSPEQRQHWLNRVRQIGPRLDTDLRSGWKARALAWLQVMRPQFYVFPWLALTAGALQASASSGAPFLWAPYLLAWAAAWLLEFISVLTNEIHDLPTDTANRNSGPFTGGSRALVQGKLSPGQIRNGRRLACLALVVVVTSFAVLYPAGAPATLLFLSAGFVLGVGYTAPPLKLVCRTWGELDVAFTHSVMVVLCGHFSQTAHGSLGPWLIAVPMFFSVLPSIILAGFPDLEADAAVGKKTVAVRFGRHAALKAGIAAVWVAAALRLWAASSSSTGSWLDAVMILHAVCLTTKLFRSLVNPRPGRIDGLLVLALSYMIWFALAPLLASLR